MNQWDTISGNHAEAGRLTSISRKPVQDLPAAYFQQFPEKMLRTIKLIDEAEPAVTRSKNIAFTIPKGYFISFPEVMITKLKSMEAIISQASYAWEDSGRLQPFAVPSAYFDQLPQQVLGKIYAHADQEETLSPLLASLKGKQVFDVPEGYLEQVPPVPQDAAPVVPKIVVHPAQRSIRWSGWAAAAAVICMFVLGGLKFLPGTTAQDPFNASEQLALVSDAAIEAYLLEHIDELGMNLLESNLSKGAPVDYSGALDDISDEDLEFYLEFM